MRCGWGFYSRRAFEAQAGNSPLQGQSKPPAKLVVLIISQHKKVGSQHLATCMGDRFCYNIFCMATGKTAVKYRGLIGKKNYGGSEVMRIAICDDEKNIREFIAEKVKKQYAKADIVFFSSGEELLLYDKQIEILIIDIQMNGKNGMETARELRKKDKKVIIIFVTAIEDYVYQAFDVGAFHYLVKPIDDVKFADVFCRAVEEWEMQDIHTRQPEEKYVMINNGGIHSKVMLEDIVYAEVFNRKVVIHKLKDEIEYYGKLSDLEALAGDSFFRPHRAYLINFKYVEKYNATTIFLEKGTVLMAKQNYPEFVKKYMKYIQKRG